MKRLMLPLTFIAALFLSGPARGADYGEHVGSVRFPTSCGDAARPHLERGLALLHSMTYEDAETAFAAAADADPRCAMAYWGQAMTYVHPLWSDPPGEPKFERGRDLVRRAQELPSTTEREAAFIAAAAAYYAEGRSPQETRNLAAFEQGWRRAHQAFPEDPEAALFYALAHLATADPADKTYAKQRRAGALAEEVLAKIPDHPGAHHYVIHSYDYPPLAAEALAAARAYGEVAPEVPHALHMPTHIFTRLGLWEESIDWNRRSAAAALEHPMGDAVSIHYLHALDYLAYAHLQRGEDRRAEEVLRTVQALEGPFHPEVATPYTLAAVPARLALERRRWAEAARLAPRVPASFPWDGFPAMEAITHFARALGAARTGDGETARGALDRLAALRDEAAAASAYWARQVEIQHQAASAWLAFADGEREAALAAMRRAAELEAATEKHPVTPGEVLPARELLADMLLEMGRHEEAGTEYEAALARSPGRLNGLYGAGRAAELAGDDGRAAGYYREVVELAAASDTERESVRHARRFLAR